MLSPLGENSDPDSLHFLRFLSIPLSAELYRQRSAEPARLLPPQTSSSFHFKVSAQEEGCRKLSRNLEKENEAPGVINAVE